HNDEALARGVALQRLVRHLDDFIGKFLSIAPVRFRPSVDIDRETPPLHHERRQLDVLAEGLFGRLSRVSSRESRSAQDDECQNEPPQWPRGKPVKQGEWNNTGPGGK